MSPCHGVDMTDDGSTALATLADSVEPDASADRTFTEAAASGVSDDH
jgi:hypothetical protein